MQSFMFTAYLLKNASKLRAKILLVFTMILGLHFTNLILGRTVEDYAGYVLSWILLSSYGPLIYAYVRSFVEDFVKGVYLNFLVPLYPLILWIFTDNLHHESSADYYFDLWASAPVYGSLLIYLILSIQKIYALSEDGKNLSWLKFLVVSFTFLVSLHLVVLFVFSSGHKLFGQILNILEAAYMLFFTSGMVYTALSKPAFFIDIQKVIDLIPKPPKYFYTGLGDVQINTILVELERFMNHERPYLDPELTLESLSQQTGIDKRHISQVVNDKLLKNFNQYINDYRVLDAMDILDQVDKDLRIFEVMYDVGFNTKSSFNLSFKQFTGETPTNYRKKCLARSSTPSLG